VPASTRLASAPSRWSSMVRSRGGGCVQGDLDVGTTDGASGDAAGIAAVGGARWPAVAARDPHAFGHAAAVISSNIARICAPDSISWWASRPLTIRLKSVQPAATYGTRNAAISSGVPAGLQRSNRS
jgi:hypothetical protein